MKAGLKTSDRPGFNILSVLDTILRTKVLTNKCFKVKIWSLWRSGSIDKLESLWKLLKNPPFEIRYLHCSSNPHEMLILWIFSWPRCFGFKYKSLSFSSLSSSSSSQLNQDVLPLAIAWREDAMPSREGRCHVCKSVIKLQTANPRRMRKQWSSLSNAYMWN